MKSSLVTFVVGLSLCSASAALLYVWLKTKNNNDDDKNRDKNQKPKLQRQNRTKVECTIENDKVPFVIGRGSHNVNKIEKDTNTKITFREKDENNHICEIVGTYEDILRAERKIKDSIRPTNVTEEFFIPEAAYNAIIGRAGKILQEICRKSMAQVHIDSGVNTSTVATTTKTELNADARRVMIKGTQQNVNAAKSFIDEKVREALKEQENEFKREPRGSPRINQSNAKDNDDLAGEDNIDGNADACQTIMEPDGIKGQLEVYVSAMASIDKFWIQLCGPQSNELDQLVEKMTKYYNETENQEIHRIDDPFLGQIVTTRFQYDSKWYRAEVVGIIPNENNPRCVALDVFFVDYGDNQYVFPHEVFGIGTEFLQLRFQAIECFLANVQPIKPTKESAWSGDAITKFEELTSVARWKKLTAEVVTTKEKNTTNSNNHVGSSITGINLFDKSSHSRINIASQLIASGHAISTTNVLRLDGGNDDDTNSNGPTNLPSTSINGHQATEIINDVNKNTGFKTSTPTKKNKKANQSSNNGNSINNNGPAEQQRKSSPIDERFSKFANKSWHDIVEEDE